jgi:hypothetical protein
MGQVDEQLEKIELMMQNQMLQTILPNFLFYTSDINAVISFGQSYADKMYRNNMFPQEPICEALYFPRLRQVEIAQREFFDSISIAAINHRQNKYNGVLLVDISEWQDDKESDDFLHYLRELINYSETIKFVFVVRDTDEDKMRAFNHVLNKYLCVTAVCLGSGESNIEIVRNYLESKSVQLESIEDEEKLINLLSSIGYTETIALVDRMITDTYVKDGTNGYISSEEFKVFLRKIEDERSKGRHKLGF